MTIFQLIDFMGDAIIVLSLAGAATCATQFFRKRS